MREYIAQARNGVEAFADADIRDQATALGNGTGNIATAGLDAVVARGASRLVNGPGRTDGPDYNGGNGPDGDVDEVDFEDVDPPAQNTFTLKEHKAHHDSHVEDTRDYAMSAAIFRCL